MQTVASNRDWHPCQAGLNEQNNVARKLHLASDHDRSHLTTLLRRYIGKTYNLFDSNKLLSHDCIIFIVHKVWLLDIITKGLRCVRPSVFRLKVCQEP